MPVVLPHGLCHPVTQVGGAGGGGQKGGGGGGGGGERRKEEEAVEELERSTAVVRRSIALAVP
eukprot:283686-Rhodomonas_salina.1